MALIHIQSMLAKIYTDAPLRQRFLSNPYEVAAEYHLDNVEIEQILELSKNQVHNFAVSLIYKRLGEVRKKLPFTARLLGKKFSRLFLQYAKEGSLQSTKKHIKDTFNFAKYIRRMAIKEEVPVWALEVMDYELMGMKVFFSSFLISVRVFCYDVQNLVEALLKDGDIQPKKRIRVGMWVKFFSGRKVFHRIS